MDPLHQCPTEVFQLPDHSPVYDILLAIKDFYKPIHTYLSIVLCAIGTICNFCNIVVLTRKQMRSPVNLILCAMACCDTVVLFSNLIYTTHYTFVAFDNCVPRHWSYGWCVFLISHAHLSLVGHSSSIWLSVMLALIRYITLRRRGKSAGVQIGLQHSYIAIASVIVFVTLMNSPNFLTYKITEQTLEQTCGHLAVEQYRNHTAYVPGVADIALDADCLVFRMAFWITGAVFKLGPCLLLTVLVSLLLRILQEVLLKLTYVGGNIRIDSLVRDNRNRLLNGSRRGIATATTATFEEQSSHQQLNYQSHHHQLDPISNSSAVFVFQSSDHAPVPLAPPLPTSSQQCQRHQRNRSSPSLSLSSSHHHTHHSPITSLLSPPQNINSGRILARVVATTVATTSPSPASSPILNNISNGSLRKPKRGSGGGGQSTRTDRTTRMLLAIVCVFLITELPQGIMAVLSGMFSEQFHSHIYNSVGDLLDLLSLTNACTSFVIYCTMSQQFRNEFHRVFLPDGRRMKCCRRLMAFFGGNNRRNGINSSSRQRRRRSLMDAKLVEDGNIIRCNGHFLRGTSPEALLEGSTSTILPARVSPLMGVSLTDSMANLSNTILMAETQQRDLTETPTTQPSSDRTMA